MASPPATAVKPMTRYMVLRLPFSSMVVEASISPESSSESASTESVANNGLVSKGIPAPQPPPLPAAITGNLPSAEIVSGLLSNLNGPATSTVTVNGPVTFFGSRHESEHVLPQPYEKL